MAPPAWVKDWQQTMLAEIQVMIDTSSEKLKVDLVAKIDSSVKGLQEQITNISDKVEILTTTTRDQDIKQEILQNQQQAMFERVLRMETRSMSANLVFSGIREHERETPNDINSALHDLFRDIDVNDIDIIRCHRMGQRKLKSQASKGHNRCIFQPT